MNREGMKMLETETLFFGEMGVGVGRHVPQAPLLDLVLYFGSKRVRRGKSADLECKHKNDNLCIALF